MRIKNLLLSLSFVGLLNCVANDRLYQSDQLDAQMECICPMQDAQFNYDAEPLDSGVILDALPNCVPYEQPHTDASISVDSGGVPGIRWKPDGGSCWFLSSLKDDELDALCEDNLQKDSWCEILGSDWGMEQNRGLNQSLFPQCAPPWN